MNDMQLSMDQREAKAKEKHNLVFSQFIGRPETKMLLSMIPKTEPDELITTILRSAFDAGTASGQGEVLVMMMDSILESPPKFDGRGF